MSFTRIRGIIAVASLLVASACGGQNGALPTNGASAQMQNAPVGSSAERRHDTTSILKKLTKNVEIGSTVDPTNGDTGPRSLALATENQGTIKKGDLLVCDFSDSSGDAGKGTSIELLSSAPGSKPATFVQNSDIEGCDGTALVTGNQTYATGLTSNEMCSYDPTGKLQKCYKSPIVDPLDDGYGPVPPGSGGLYSPFFVFVGDVGSGSLDALSLGLYGTGKTLQAVSGFPVSKGSGYSALGPSGMVYNNVKGTLYVVDGACNAVIAIEKAPNLLLKDEIMVGPTCKTFTCKEKKDTCATLVKAGSPLNKPEAAAILPNGNLIVANTASNELVELTPTGQVLDTKVVSRSKKPGIYALWAIGKNDSDTALYYTDTNTNTVQELEQ
jgi:hypothetical protein